MTRVKVTYLAMDEEQIPLVTADSFANLKLALDEYFGVDKNQAECLGWFPYECKYSSYYEGYYEYKWENGMEIITDQVKVYCLEFYPNTIYEVNDNPTQ